MSYSRWGSSCWYTYWLAQEKEDYDTATFCICGLTEFTAKQLRNDLNGCIKKVKVMDKKADELDIDELIIYIKRFLKDVDDQYNIHGRSPAEKN